MALPIRDGNQSLTTLSTILVSNAHIPAHTVVSFGTQGITDIATAVSGVELGPNTLNALENITVTLGQVTITGGLTDAQLRASAVTIGGGIYIADAQVVLGGSAPSEAIQIGGYNLADSKLYPIHVDELGVQTIKGAVTASISGTPSVTFSTAVITGSTSILNFPATQTVTFSQAPVTFGTAVITGSTSIIGTPSVTFTTATITGSTSILNFPATQTVTFTQITTHGVTIANTSVTVNGTFYQATQPVSLTTLPALVASTAQIGSVTASISGTPSVTFGTAVITGSASIIGTPSVTFTQIATHGVTIANSSVTIGGTVTASISSGTLAEVTKANTFTNLDWIYVAGNFTYTYGMDTTPTLYLNAYFKRTGATQWSSFAYSTGEDKCTATITQEVGGDDSAFWALNVNYYSPSGPPASVIGMLAYYNLDVPYIYSEIPPKTGWIINEGGGFSGSVSVSYDQPNIIPVSIGAGTEQIGSVTVGNSVTISSLPAISGTVTANSSNGSLTTRFGTVATANTAFQTSAVTNANRKYLLIQNITTASNVITIGIGFTPTTTQGIQLFAGAGLTFEGTYIPTGAVNLLSSVTASCYTILEA